MHLRNALRHILHIIYTKLQACLEIR